jgi:hypothetical protein
VEVDGRGGKVLAQRERVAILMLTGTSIGVIGLVVQWYDVRSVQILVLLS